MTLNRIAGVGPEKNWVGETSWKHRVPYRKRVRLNEGMDLESRKKKGDRGKSDLAPEDRTLERSRCRCAVKNLTGHGGGGMLAQLMKKVQESLHLDSRTASGSRAENSEKGSTYSPGIHCTNKIWTHLKHNQGKGPQGYKA